MERKKSNLKKIFGLMAIILFSIGHAQMSIEGTVKSAEGFPEANASVSIDGKNPVFADADGHYTMKVQESQAKKGKITILADGISGTTATKVISYKNGTTKKVNLVLESIALKDVVAIGYGTARKKDLSGAVVSIKPDETMAATTNSVADLLQGQVSGVSMVSGGSTPGAASSIIIRGANSLKGDSQPLYVIDNVPQSSTAQTMSSTANDFQMDPDPLAGIDPNDIESIQVLKDASATAIYGSRGANGVILITTKKGKIGDARITFSTNLSFSKPVDLMPTMNLRQYAKFYNRLAPNGDPNKIGFKFEGDKIIYKYNEREAEVHSRDWMDEALRTAFSKTYNLNANGGTKKVKYNISVGYKDIQGIVRQTGFKHGDFRINLNARLSDKLKVNLISTGFLRRNNMMPGGNPYGASAGGIINAALDYRPYLIPKDAPDFDQPANLTTVFSWLNDFQDVTKEYKYSLSADLNYKITPHLNYTFRTGGNMNNVNRVSWYGLELSLGRGNNGYLGESVLDRNNYNIENLLNYNRNFGGTNVSLMGGVTYDAYTWLNKKQVGTGFPYDVLGVDGMSLATTVKTSNPLQQDYQLLSYLGRANFSFLNGKYILTGTFRADGTSKFKKGKRWGYFPSFAVAWNVKQEEFMQNFDFLNQLKLRAGYGKTGSQGIAPYNTISVYSIGVGYANADRNQIKGLASALNNPGLIWESTSSYNAGIDFAVFKNRIEGSVDAYTKTTSNLLMDISLPLSTSFGSIATNQGSVYNKGIEGRLDIDVIKTKGFTWNVSGNIAFNRSKFEGAKSFFGSVVRPFGSPNKFIEGRAPGLFYGYKTDGIVQKYEEQAYIKSFKLGGVGYSDAGNIKFVDVNGDGVINTEDQTVIGDPNPDFNYGLQTSISYKRLKLSASFTGVKGGDILNTYYFFQDMALYSNYAKNMNPAATAYAWTPEHPDTNFPRIRAQLPQNIVLDRYLESGSYFRCTDITLGYDLPSKLLKQIKLKRLRFYMSVKNAFTITNYSGFDVAHRSFYSDPTVRGVDRYSFPSQRTFIFGGTFTF